MKNNRILFLIIVFLVSLFGFGINVNAAEELTCLYNEEGGIDSSNYMYLLVQYGDGKIEVYRNRDNHYDLDAPGWTLFDNYIFDSSVVKDENGNLPLVRDANGNLSVDSCPNPDTLNNGTLSFYGSYKFGRASVVNDYPLNEVKIPTNLLVKSDSYTGGCSKENWLKVINAEKYDGACLYLIPSDECHLIQVNYGTDYIEVTEHDSRKGFKYSAVPYATATYEIEASFKNNIKLNDFLGANEGNCPKKIYVKRNSTSSDAYAIIVNTSVYLNQERGTDAYTLINKKGMNPITKEPFVDLDDKLNYSDINILNCDQLFDGDSEELRRLIKTIYNFIKILVPIMILVLSTLDFAKTIFSGKEDDMKKVTKRFVSRLVIVAIIFLFPILLKLLLTIAYDIWGILSPDFCGIL